MSRSIRLSSILFPAVWCLKKRFGKNDGRGERGSMSEADMLIFDLDGTLVDSREHITHAVNEMLRDLDLPQRSFDEVVAVIGTGVRDLVYQCAGQRKEVVDRGVELFTNHYRRNLEEMKVFSGVEDVLEHFREKVLLVTTNARKEMAEAVLKAVHLDTYFLHIVGGDDDRCLKPDACPVDRARELFRVPPSRAVFIGDMDVDILAGKRAGLITCGVTYGVGDLQSLRKAGPDFLIDRIVELKKIIR
ncbi:MAG: HAD hydrolase-like protein [Candidatus Omnitrophica bacterium]|nr:HAD hydrolase-like protein [Candidatus Omnitrophota bacterium]